MSDPGSHRALIDRIADGSAPENVRAAAARGALPLPPAALAEVYLRLREDEDEAIRTQAAASLQEIDSEGVLELLRDPDCHALVLQHFAATGARDALLAERIAFHPSTPDDAIAVLAARGNGTVLDLVLTNQERLLQQPLLLERLMNNPALRADQRGKILDLLERISATEARLARAEDGAPDADDEAFAEAAQLLEVDIGELFEASEIVDGHEFAESDDDDVRSAYQRIVAMNPAQKAICALKGNREERSILVRDTNKTVALGVIKNPRITDTEIEGIAKMRNVSDEVLRAISLRREWTKSPTICMSLLLNPRTPPAVSTNFIPRLQIRELKALTKNREVPELIRRNARRLMAQRQAKQSKSLRK